MIKKILTVMLVALCLLFTATTAKSDELPDGYDGVKFGMLMDEAEKIIRKEGKTIFIKKEFYKGKCFIMADGKMLGEKVEITYFFTPLSKKFCYAVIVCPTLSYDIVNVDLSLRYGQPNISEKKDLRKNVWRWENVYIYLEEKINEKDSSKFAGLTIDNIKLKRIRDKEQKQLKLKEK